MAHSSKHNSAVADSLLRHPALKRVANFGNGQYLPPTRAPRSLTLLPFTAAHCYAVLLIPAAFQLFAPRLYQLYDFLSTSIRTHHPHIRHNFPNNVFASITINLGPQTVTRKHLDNLNIPFGWCVVTALGNYDHTRGGHIVLWDLRMIVEFPPGSTIFLPSACISHSNTAVGEGERRYSITQYTSGGIMRWVACGFRSHRALKEAGDLLIGGGKDLWRDGAQLLSTWDELKASFRRST